MPRDPDSSSLLDALQQPGCPVCRLAAAGVRRYLETLAYEALTDPDVRIRLGASHGFCVAHAAVWESLHNAVGTALIYRNVVQTAREALATGGQPGLGGMLRGLRAGRGPGSAAGRALAAALVPTAPCPACTAQAPIAARFVDTLAAGFADPEIAAAYAGHDSGVCLPHFRAVLPRLPDAASVAAVAAAQAAHLARTAADLDEVLRKADYRFRDEPDGPEYAALARVLDQVAGSLPPTPGQ